MTNSQLNKLEFEAENMTKTTLRITKQKFQDEKLPHELFQRRRQKKIRNAFANNMSTDIKLSKA